MPYCPGAGGRGVVELVVVGLVVMELVVVGLVAIGLEVMGQVVVSKVNGTILHIVSCADAEGGRVGLNNCIQCTPYTVCGIVYGVQCTLE